jgi:hypothetical protein
MEFCEKKTDLQHGLKMHICLLPKTYNAFVWVFLREQLTSVHLDKMCRQFYIIHILYYSEVFE